MGPKSREKLVRSGHQNRDSDQLFVVLFFTVFRGVLFESLVDFRYPKPPFRVLFASTLRVLGLWEKS